MPEGFIAYVHLPCKPRKLLRCTGLARRAAVGAMPPKYQGVRGGWETARQGCRALRFQTQKGALVPSHGTRAPYSRGATHVQSGKGRSLCPSVAGREPRPSPGPLVGPSPAPLPRTLSADGVLSVAVDVAVLAPSGRFCLTIVSQTGKKVNPYSSQAGEKSTSPQLPLFCWRVTTGFGSVSSSPPAVVRTARNSRS